MSEFETILVEKQGAVTVVTLNRPKALNALNDRMMNELGDALEGSTPMPPSVASC